MGGRETGRYREFNGIYGQDRELAFWQVLDDLAQDIKQLLYLVRSGSEAPRSGATIYLAETTSDLEADRNQIRRELTDHGHLVLPDQPLPLRGQDLESVIAGYLDRADLSVHPVGAYYGVVPEARSESLHQIENTLAAARSREGKLIRLVWIPSDLEVRDDRQRAFVEALGNDPDLTDEDGVLETTREELKSHIQDRLEPRGPAPIVPETQTIRRVYLVCDQSVCHSWASE